MGDLADKQMLSPPAEQNCRRCRNSFSDSLRSCPYCGAASLRTFEEDISSPLPEKRGASQNLEEALLTVCIAYGVMLFLNVFWALSLTAGLAETPESYVLALIIIDAIFLIATAVAWQKTRFVPVVQEAEKSRWMAWTMAIPILALALLWNCGYHHLIQMLFGISSSETLREDLGSWTAVVLLICVEPAISEEIFFRGIAWKSVRTQMGAFETLLTTSAMFAMAHIGVPLSAPGLFGVGVALGIARLWSGGIILPMILHFCHNLVIVLFPEL